MTTPATTLDGRSGEPDALAGGQDDARRALAHAVAPVEVPALAKASFGHTTHRSRRQPWRS